jgi:hypothetical protein
MKLIIAGSRELSVHWTFIDEIIRHFNKSTAVPRLQISEVVSGTARGIDTDGERWATARDVYVRRFPADWDKHGKAAGIIRNKQMAEYGDALLLIWDGKSKGSKNMGDTMRGLGKSVYEVVLNG